MVMFAPFGMKKKHFYLSASMAFLVPHCLFFTPLSWRCNCIEVRDPVHKILIVAIVLWNLNQNSDHDCSELNDTVIEAQQRIRENPPPLVFNNAINRYLQSNNRLLILVSSILLLNFTIRDFLSRYVKGLCPPSHSLLILVAYQCTGF